jgi:hypothetical protein
MLPRGQALVELVRRLCRGDENDALESTGSLGTSSHVQVTAVHGVKGTAEDAQAPDAPPGVARGLDITGDPWVTYWISWIAHPGRLVGPILVLPWFAHVDPLLPDP